MRAGAMTLVLASVLVFASTAAGQAPTQDSVVGSALVKQEFREKYGRGPNHDYAMRRCVRRYTGF
jgi:K+-transporting ATPase c subunit